MLLDTPAAELGAPAPPFELPALDGSLVSLEDAMGPGGVVVAFICNHCPYVKAIIKDLVADANALSEVGVGVVAIMSNDYARYPADSPDAMRAFAAQHGMTFPYLLDEDQTVAKAYGAVCTPDFFGYDHDGLLRYRGRLDNGSVKRPEHRTPELLNAMRQVASSGAAPVEQHASIGCSLKWKA